jgi:hypothetical protein
MSTYDKRSNSKRTPVWEHSITQMSWANLAGHAIQTETVPINGIIKQLVIVISAATSNPTVTILITDPDGNTIYTTGALADGTTYVKTVTTDFAEGQLSFAKGFIVSVDPSADAGASGLTVDVDIRGL